MSGHNTEALSALYAQIEEVCAHFKQIRSEAASISQAVQMADATLHLNDVLQSTEEAALTILDAATAISYIAEGKGVPSDIKEKLAEQVTRIYDVSSFQDISGQRIKKVLTHLNTLEAQLQRLSDMAQGQFAPSSTSDGLFNGPQSSSDGLLNGPQLASRAPSQAEIDQIFGSAKEA